MKRISKKIFTLVFGAAVAGILLINKALAYPIGGAFGPDWDPAIYYLSPSFWALNPLDSDLSLVTFGDNVDGTLYTRKFNNYTQGDCSSFAVQYINSGDTNFGAPPIEGLTGNTIYVLSSGSYSVDPTFPLSGNCIGIFGNGDVVFNTEFDLTNANNVIVDNIQSTQFEITSKAITNNKNVAIGLLMNNIGRNLYFEITGDVSTSVTNSAINDNTLTTGNIVLSNGDGLKNLDISFRDPNSNVFVNHIITGVILDETTPIFTGATLGSTGVINNGYYNDNIKFTFNDDHLSGATLSGVKYINNSEISIEGTYLFNVADTAGNNTGLVFTIDKTNPIITGTTEANGSVTNGGLYNTGISFDFSDTNLSGATIDGSGYTNNSTITTEGSHTLIVTDLAGNTSSISFEIDTTAPLLDVKTSHGTNVISGVFYNDTIDIYFSDTNLSQALLNNEICNNGRTVSNGNYELVVTDLAGNVSAITFGSDLIQPQLVVKTADNSNVISGGLYNKYIRGTFSDDNLSGALLNGLRYDSGTLITGNQDYLLSIFDKAMNSVSISFTIDTIDPIITGKDLNNNIVQTGGVYSTGVSFVFDDDHLSGATLNSTTYISGGLINTERKHILTVKDQAGNSTGLTFYIDYTNPTITGTVQGGGQVTNGGVYNTGVSFIFSDLTLSGAILDGNQNYTNGTIILIEGNHTLVVSDKAGHTSSISFTIDMTPPLFTGYTIDNQIIKNGSGYNTTGAYFSFDPLDATTVTLSGVTYTHDTVFSGEGNYVFVIEDAINNKAMLSFWIDQTNPTISGTTLAGEDVLSGGLYNTGINFTISDNTTTTAKLDGKIFNNKTITGEGNHSLVVTDLAGNISSIIFSINTSKPVFDGNTLDGQNVINSGVYNTGVYFTFDTGHTSNVSINLNPYTHGSTISAEGNYVFRITNTIGNSASMAFSIDYTNPVIIGKTITNLSISSGGYYNTGMYFTFADDHFSGAKIDLTNYSSGTVNLTEGSHTINAFDKAGNSTSSTFFVDTTNPTVTGSTMDGKNVISGGYYNTGVSFTFSDTNFSGAILNNKIYTGGTLITGENIYTLTGYDKAGNTATITFTIDLTNPSCSSYSPISGSNLSGYSLNISWNGCSDNLGLSGYRVDIYDQSNTLLTGIYTTGSSIQYDTLAGTYKRKLNIYDKAGNIGLINTQTISYMKILYAGLEIPGTLYQNKYYVNSSTININLSGNMALSYQFSGDTLSNTIGTYSNGTINRSIIFSGSDGDKNIRFTYWTGGQTGSIGPTKFYLDTTNPILTGIYPNPALKTNKTGINFQWAGTDTGAGIVGYALELDGNTIYTGAANSFTKSNISDGIHTWKVYAIDYAGNTNGSSISSFTIDTSFPTISGVTGNKYYNNDVTPIFAVGSGILNGQTFTSGTPITGEGAYTLVVTNDVGNSTTVGFVIDKTNPGFSIINPISGSIITTNPSVTFSRTNTDANISGYIFNLYGAFSTGVTTIGNSVTISSIPNNTYSWNVQAIDKAGNTASTGGVITLNVPLTGTVTLSGKALGPNNTQYTNNSFSLQSQFNKNATLAVIGDVSSTISDTLSAGISKINTISPTSGDGIKTFIIQATNGGDSFVMNLTGYVDTTAPSIPSFSGQNTNYSGAFTLSWTNSIDAGVGIKDYVYNISNGSTNVKSGISSTNSLSISNMELGITGNYTIYMAARDLLDNTSSSGSFAFIYTGIEDKIPDSFSLTKQYDVDLDTEIKSEKVTVAGLTTGTKVLATAEDGTLYINGTEYNTTGYVQNGDKVQIAIYSSEDYDDLTEGTLTIGDKTSTFKVVTISEEEDEDSDTNDEDGEYEITELSSTQKLHVSMIYNTLSNLYDDNDSQLEDFMLTFKYIVKDKIEQMIDDDEDEESIETLEYLYNLINSDFDGEAQNGTSNGTYTAPNGKEYTIKNVSGKGYTATNFIFVKYFDTLSEIKAYIDKNNPKSVYVGGDFEIDQSRSTSTYTAPNGKVYTFFKTTDGKYGSNNFFTAKLFTDLSVMKHHIDVNNPKR